MWISEGNILFMLLLPPGLQSRRERPWICGCLEVSMALARVLVVDDDEVVRETLRAILQKHDFEVTCAANVSQALKFISSQKYDVLLSDLHMPGAGDGLTVVSAMRHA